MTSTAQPTPSDKPTIGPSDPPSGTLKGLSALTKDLQAEVAQLKAALEQEREHVRLLQRQKQDEMKRVRQEEQQKACLQANELRSRLQQEKLAELHRQKEILTRNFETEFQRLLHRTDEETRQARADVRRVRDELTAQVRDAERRAAQRSLEAAADPELRRLTQEVAELRGAKRHLEEVVNAAREKERRLVSELRRAKEKHDLLAGVSPRWQKADEEVAVRKLVRELKAKDRMIGQLEWKLLNHRLVSSNSGSPKSARPPKPDSSTAQQLRISASRGNQPEIPADQGASTKPEAQKHAKKRKLSPNMSPEAGSEAALDQKDLKAVKKNLLAKVSPAMYKRLYAEHLQLQRSFALLRHLVAEEQVNNGNTTKISTWAREKLLLENTIKEFRQKVEELSDELRESQEQNELLEFRVLELEQCQGKGAFSKSYRECAVNTEPCDGVAWPGGETNAGSFEFLVKQFPITDPKEEHANDIKNSLKTIFSYPGIPVKQRQELARAAAHLDSCHIVMNRIRCTIAELVAKTQALEQDKKALVAKLAPSELSETFERYQEQLDKTRQRLSEAEEELRSASERSKLTEQQLNEKNVKIQELEELVKSQPEKQEDILLKQEVVLSLGEDANELTTKADRPSNISDVCSSCQQLQARVSQGDALCKELRERLKESEKCEQELTEKNLRLYIDYVSAKEQIQRLLLEIASGAKNAMQGDATVAPSSREMTDSFGHAISSEDEGLGEESRRGDSTGPSSLVDLQELEADDLITKTSEVDSDVLEDSGYDMTPSLESDVTSVSMSEKTSTPKADAVQVAAMRKELSSLQEMFDRTKRERDEYHEQALELEEAENDARRECQRLQGQMDLLLDRGEELQMHLVSARKQLDYSNRRAKILEANCDELTAQVNYLGALLEQYKGRVQCLEDSEMGLQQKLVELSTALVAPHPARMMANKCDRAVQANAADDGSVGEEARAANTDVVSIGKVDKPIAAEMVYIEDENGFDLQEGDVQIQVDMSDEDEPKPVIATCSTQTDLESPDRCPLCVTPTVSEDGGVHRCPSFPAPWEKVPPPSLHLDLMERLSALEQDDSNLQEQLHKMDEMNLALWQKLHQLETRVGMCKKATLPQQGTPTDPAVRVEEEDAVADDSVDKHRSATARLDVLLLEQANAKKEDEAADSASAPNTCQEHILERILNLESSEHKLKERLIQLEHINQEFEKELEMREKLYREKEARNRDWTDIESELHRLIRNLEKERSCLLQKVTVLEEEKRHLQKELETQRNQLSLLKEHHTKELEEMQRKHEELVSGLCEEIDHLHEREKRHLNRLSQLEQEKESLMLEKVKTVYEDEEDGVGQKVEKIDEKYVAVSQELEQVKDAYREIRQQIESEKEMMLKMKDHFEDQLRELLNMHCRKEKKLEGEISFLLTKERDYSKQIANLHDKEAQLLHELKAKEKELEEMRSQHTERMKLLEEEHKVIEAELQWKLKEVEENTTVAVKALQDEKSQVEVNLEADLKDLRDKEAAYKERINELENKISELREEINELTNSAAKDAKSERASRFTREDVAKLLEELKEMHSREQSLKQSLEDMEKREAAYQETLQNADIIVSSLQRSYQEKIDELETSEKQLKLRIAYLENVETRLRSFLKNEKGTEDTKRSRELIEELIEADTRENNLRERICTLEMNEKGLMQKVREMEKRQKQLELELQEHDELMATIDSLQRQREEMKKEIAKLQRSEQVLQEMLIQSEALLSRKDQEIREKFQSMADDNKSQEETINQMRNHIKELNEQLASSQLEADKITAPQGETIHEPAEPDVRESEVEQEFRAEVARLRHSLSSTNDQLLEMDGIRRRQDAEISELRQKNRSLQQQVKCLEETIHFRERRILERKDEARTDPAEDSAASVTDAAPSGPEAETAPEVTELEECVKRALIAVESEMVSEVQQQRKEEKPSEDTGDAPKAVSPPSPPPSPKPSPPESAQQQQQRRHNSYSNFWPSNRMAHCERTSTCVVLHDFGTTSFPAHQTSAMMMMGHGDVRHHVQLTAGQRVTVIGSTLPDGNCVVQLQDHQVLVPAKILREIGALSAHN